jgi:hypothetical protein
MFHFKNRKKEQKIKKNIKGPRGSLLTQARNRPMAQPTPPPETVSPLFSSFTDAWDPHVSTNVVFNLDLIFTPRDSAITRINPIDSVPFSSPPRAYKYPFVPHSFP